MRGGRGPGARHAFAGFMPVACRKEEAYEDRGAVDAMIRSSDQAVRQRMKSVSSWSRGLLSDKLRTMVSSAGYKRPGRGPARWVRWLGTEGGISGSTNAMKEELQSARSSKQRS